MTTVSRVSAFPPTVILAGLKVLDTWSLRTSMALKRLLKPQMALKSRDEVSVWITLSLEILREGEAVVEAVDLAIAVVVEVVDLVTGVAEVVVVAVVVAVGVVIAVIVVVVVVPLEACPKTAALPPLQVKKPLSKLCLPPVPFPVL
jgi:hypothetical protein